MRGKARRPAADAGIKGEHAQEHRSQHDNTLPGGPPIRLAGDGQEHGAGGASKGNGFHSAPIGRGAAGIEFVWKLITASELDAGEEVPWVWRGYIADGHTTLFSGAPKAGKTTLLSHVLKLCGAGGDLGGAVSSCRVLVVSEESGGIWKQRCEELAIENHVSFCLRPFKGRPHQKVWEDAISQLAWIIRERDIGLVVFDTWAAISPADDENDSVKVLDALRPLHRLTEAGAAVLLVHHLRKTEANGGQGARGSNALMGFVDIIAELHLEVGNRRKLKCISRFGESLPEQILELADAGYVAHGGPSAVARLNRQQIIRGLLPDAPPGVTVEEIHERWTTSLRPGVTTLRGDIAVMSAVGNTGSARRGDPKRYYRLADSIPSAPISIGAESNPKLGSERAEAVGN